MNFQNDITEQYLMKIYDDLSKESMNLMNSIKSNSPDMVDDDKKQTAITKQISLINSINMSIIRLRNLRKKIQQIE
jgi:predicted transcriptional regulator